MPKAPRTTDPVQHTLYERRLIGIIVTDRKSRAAERKCVRDLKAKGLIR